MISFCGISKHSVGKVVPDPRAGGKDRLCDFFGIGETREVSCLVPQAARADNEVVLNRDVRSIQSVSNFPRHR